jgi:sugar transferase EpsL
MPMKPPEGPRRRRERRLKEAMDRLGALLGLVVCLPALAIVAFLIRITLGKPVLFRQRRPGLRGAPFDLIKFRTMRQGLSEDAERLTRLGSFLRSTSLDELPQLWNVFRGEMSLVGPRPLLMHYLGLYTPEQARRHEVKPGLTGWAQVNGRNALGWEGRLALDVWYVDHWSLPLDLQILARTAQTVLTRRGITAAGSATMPEFRGTAPRGGHSPSERLV